MTDHQNHPKRSIADHTTTCPYCGHRCLPANLKGHVQRIHPEKAREESFLGHLERTRPDTWWQRYQPQHETRVSPSFLAPVEVNAPRQAKRGGKPARDYSDYVMCKYCARWMPHNELDQHISHHQVNEPFGSLDEVHCPVCGLNERLAFIASHMRHIHPTYTKKMRNRFIQEQTERIGQLKAGQSRAAKQPPFSPTPVDKSIKTEPATTPLVPDVPVGCPYCETSVEAKAFYGHLAKKHAGLMATRFGDRWVMPASLNAIFTGYSATICCPACGENIDHLLFFNHVSGKHMELFFPNL